MNSTSAFESPRLTHKRAKHHIRDLKEVVDKFTHEHPWAYVIDADSRAPNLVHKIKFHKLPPADVACILFDTVNNLRATLDQIGYSAALASGKAKPWAIKFLFGDEVKDPAKWTSKDLPAEIVNLFRSDETLQGRQRSASISTKTMRATLLASATVVRLNLYLTVLRSSIPLAHRRKASLRPRRWCNVAQAPTTGRLRK
jgi:hypothetical protein